MDENVQVGVQNGSGNALVKKLGFIIAAFVFLLPVFFIPSASISLYAAKITLLATGLVAIFAIFLASVLSTGSIEIPKAKYVLPLAAFGVVALLSSVFSGSIISSVAGNTFDSGTSGSIIMLVFASLMTIVSLRNVGAVNKVISAFIYSSLALSVYTLFGSLLGSSLPVSLASKMPQFISGGMIDTAIIFGAATILSLCAINMSEVSKKMKYLLYALVAFSLLFIGAANFMPVTIILGLVSLVFFVYILSWSVGGRAEAGQENAPADRKISLSSLAVLIVSVIFLLGGSSIGGYLSGAMKIGSTEVRPNFQTTMNLAASSWKENLAFGIGPNRFADFWAKNKPLDINQTQFWNADFYSGSGFIPTMAITTGALGLLSLLAFVVMYALSGVKAIFAQANSGRSRYLATSSFLVSLYLWVMLFLYTPSISVLALAFIFTGLFTATLVPQGITGVWKINMFSNPKTNFLSVLSIVILLIVAVAGGYYVWERTVASTTFSSGVVSYQQTGDIPRAREMLIKSIGMAPSDVYWRSLAEVSLADLGRLMGNVTDSVKMTDAVRTEAQTLIANSVEAAKKATELGNSNFQNWFALGRVYEVLAGTGIEGSVENARSAYTEAALRSPNNPMVPLALSRLDALAGNIEGAKANIAKSLELKPNYTDAFYTLAQLEAASNNIPGAIRSVEAAAIVDPTNSGLYFQLGLLKYNQKDYAGAAMSLERAVSLVPDYANAKYFLGLSYFEIGKKSEAIKQFEDIKATNPDNQEVNTILTNMKAGKAPTWNAAVDKSKLPVKED